MYGRVACSLTVVQDSRMSRDFHHWFHPSYSLVLAACDVSVDHLKMPENNIDSLLTTCPD